MAPPAGVRVGGRLQFFYEEVVERLHDIFSHPHELVVRGGRRHVLCHKVAIGLCGVAEIERERCRGAPDEVFRRELFSSDKLCHDIGEREGEVA